MNSKIVNNSKHPLPAHETPYSAGLDIRANLDEPVVLKSMERKVIPTGLYMELPAGFDAQIRPRSGLAMNKGISVLNIPGTIDSDYRGEIGIILINLSEEEFVTDDGDRICQMVINKVETASWVEEESLQESDRGSGGFGHTGNS